MATKIGLDAKRTAAAQRMIESLLGAVDQDMDWIKSCTYRAIDSDWAELLEITQEEFIKNLTGKLRLAMSIAMQASCHSVESVPQSAYAETEKE